MPSYAESKEVKPCVLGFFFFFQTSVGVLSLIAALVPKPQGCMIGKALGHDARVKLPASAVVFFPSLQGWKLLSNVAFLLQILHIFYSVTFSTASQFEFTRAGS